MDNIGSPEPSTVNELPAPPPLPALPPPKGPGETGAMETNQETTAATPTRDEDHVIPPLPPLPLPAVEARIAAPATTTAPAPAEISSTGAPQEPNAVPTEDNAHDIPPLPPLQLPAAEVASAAVSTAAPQKPNGTAPTPAPTPAPAVSTTKSKKRKRAAVSSPKRFGKTSLHFKSDIDPANRDDHPRGILHASKVPSSSNAREEHVFAWIAEIIDDEDVRVAAHLTEYGFRASHMKFIPYSSKANWMARYPHAKPCVACDSNGDISGKVPQWDDRGGTGCLTSKKKSSSKKKTSKKTKAPPKLVTNGLLPNLERDELHLAIHSYFSWLYAELSEMETTQAGRRQVSNAGVSVPGLQSLVSKLEGTFKAVQLEKERKEKEINARSLVMQLEKERRENEANAAAAGVLDLNDDVMVMGLPLMPDGSPMLQQQQQPKEIATEQQKKTTEIPFLEQSLEAELRHMVADKLPQKSTNSAQLKQTSATEETKVSWRQLDFDTMFQKLVDFKAKKGHPSPPVKHPELGRWVSELRLNKKMLREKGLEYEPELSMEEDDKHTLAAAVAMQRDRGDEAISTQPQQQLKDSANSPIDTTATGNTSHTRNNINTILTQSRVTRLDSIGFTWAVLPVRVTWEQRLEELRTFKERHGRFPSNKEGTIGNWLKGQRKLYTKKDADFMANRCAKLEELGVPLRQRNYTALSWDDRFQQLVEFGRVNRHFKVPNPAPDNGGAILEDPNSGAADANRFYKFTQKIHTEYRALQRGVPSTMLTEERIAQLQNIGFEFSTKADKTVPDLDWSTRIQQLEAFLSEMGHLRVDPNYDKYSNLGGWAVEMSERHRSWQEGTEYLLPDMVEKFAQLNALGFSFDVFPSRRGERSWEDSFNLLLLYRQETGSCRVPHHYKADCRLGSWVAVQRKEYKLLAKGKPSRMTHEHIQRLESIGFEWVARRGD